MISQQGFLLSFLKYGENDAILHCFTEEEGYQTYFLQGIYTKKNKKKALLLPLNHLNINLKSTKSGNLQTISRIELIKTHDLYEDIKANTVIFFVADFLNQILRNENKNPHFYHHLERFVFEINSKNYQSHLVFLLLILKILGVTPLLENGKFLNPETGTFQETIINQSFTEEISSFWKSILISENPYETKIPSSYRKQFLESVLLYYHYHVADFKTPQSLEIIQQIFE